MYISFYSTIINIIRGCICWKEYDKKKINYMLYFVKKWYSWFHENGSLRVHSFNKPYLSIYLFISQYTSSWGTHFHETHNRKTILFIPKLALTSQNVMFILSIRFNFILRLYCYGFLVTISQSYTACLFGNANCILSPYKAPIGWINLNTNWYK